MNHKVRRRYIVNGEYQLRQAAGVVVANVLLVVLTSLLLAWLYLVAWDTTLICNHNRQMPMLIGFFGVCVLLITLFFSFRRSREVAGMMEKLAGVLAKAAKGDIPEGGVSFRKTDSFLQLTPPLNACLEQLRVFRERAELGKDDTAVLEHLVQQIEAKELEVEGVRRVLEEIIEKQQQKKK